ncbi:PEP/pyruvate-binding domain-containing protein [Fodinicola feengrottensis]|uniref:PEP/pyruvate-binding domain-containing protein n=1 Tax=Fodinicola feengrottensis TaxID=435914 RepID=UPI0031D450E9
MTENALVLPLADESAELGTAGGKGASLARLGRAGLPVPPGFHVTTHAYRAFVAEGLGPAIKAAPEADVLAAFENHDLPADVAAAILQAYEALGDDIPVAVRSSATAEDLPELSFAGQHDTFLNVVGPGALLVAVRRCWASLWTARAVDYRRRNGIPSTDVAIAVVVQQLVPADAAGVLFTANPVTGARDELVVNAAWGLGEAVVGGQVSPDTYVLARGSHREISRNVQDKTVMTVRTPDGTREEPTPGDLRHAAVLDEARTAELAALGERIERLYGLPMDVEWAVHNGQSYILQARPITHLRTPIEVWNDSLRGDYLWTSVNVGEAVPSVMTPVTWSFVRTLSDSVLGGHPSSGNIGGRFYLNLSLPITAGVAVGLGSLVRRTSEQTFGRLPAEVEVPLLPMSRPAVVRAAVATAIGFLRQGRAYRKELANLLKTNPARCEELREYIGKTSTPPDLLALWKSDVDAMLRIVCKTLDAGARTGIGQSAKLRRSLPKLVGDADANTLLTGLHGDSGELASLGPVLGLARLKRGQLDRDTYARTWGHRCADEFEVSVSRPAEDPAWLDRQLGGAAQDPEDLLERQAKVRDEAWQRLRVAHPSKADRIRRRLDRAAMGARSRERARSEMVRGFWVLRAFVVRAGALTGRGDDLFFLPIEEILTVLAGDQTPLAAVPSRRAAYHLYRTLPPYPTYIRGHFDPPGWAADPHRRNDIYHESSAPAPVTGREISGFPGAAGIVEGLARVIGTVEEGDALQPGEILVTTVTNIGWTPLFPRAAAIVTDVGAPLSHAAIVARELGIPAVVGCGTATSRLTTGDRIRVDGAKGTVTLL